MKKPLPGLSGNLNMTTTPPGLPTPNRRAPEKARTPVKKYSPWRHCLGLGLVALLGWGTFSCTQQPRYAEALPPEKALQAFKLNENFTIELFAAEPQVADPVEMVFDEQGRAFVVEMPDYPYKPEPGQGSGRIRMLTDINGDGRIDRSTIFADSLADATSILPWKGGLLVTAAPHILYLKDTNGDLRADRREVLFSGFFENNSEAQITSLRFGVDNWIYAANHGQDGQVRSHRQPSAAPLPMRGADFRFRLDRDQFELETGPAQFGQTLNDWGHRFFTQNTLHIRQAVIPGRYLRRHPYLPSTEAVLNISDHELTMFQLTPPPYWRAERTKNRNQQYTEQKLDRVEYAEDHFTGAAGGTVYGGDAFPQEFYGNIFTGDVAGNLVHRDVLMPVTGSPAYRAQRAATDKEQEFLASTDPWFRPANFTVGPDGYLYVIDMYRQHIETPVSITDDLKADMDFKKGDTHGRIYRIKPKNNTPAQKAVPRLHQLETAALVELLAHPNQWWRLQAQRLLLERQDAAAVPALKKLFTQHADPRVRLHAFFGLEGLRALDATLVKQALQDQHPGVREHGVILAERFPVCLPQLLQKINDPSARVALQASLSLGEFPAKQVVPALAGVLAKYPQDPWFRLAVLSSQAGSSPELLALLVQQGTYFKAPQPENKTFLEEYAYVLGVRHQAGELTQFLKVLAEPAMGQDKAWQLAGLAGLAKGLQSSKNKAPADPRLKIALQNLQSQATPAVRAAIQEVEGLI